MEWSKEKYEANKLGNIAELDKLKGKLYAGYILAMDGGHIRAEVYRKGRKGSYSFVCFLHHFSSWDNNPGWFRSGRCYSAQDAVVDALHKAGYNYEPEHGCGWCDGDMMLRAIGQESGGGFKIYNFGWF